MQSIIFYTNNSDPRALEKDLTRVRQLTNPNPNSVLSLDNPIIRLQYVSAMANVNYLYIPTFNRYYFIDRIEYESGQTMALYCSCDVLYSFKDLIKECKGTAIRNEKMGSTYIADSKLPIMQERFVSGKYFPLAPLKASQQGALDARTMLVGIINGGES